MDTNKLALVELLFFFGGAFVFFGWQFYSLRRDKRKDDQTRKANAARAPQASDKPSAD
jgi:hypothetical protein